jgi:Ser/Thr protein kinase RdoA (MazF antagonist)
VAKASQSDGTHKGARIEARREYETLCTLQRVFPQDAHFGTLVSLGYLEAFGRGVSITRHSPGVDLNRHLRTLGESGVQGACHAAGRWLRRLHDSAPDDGAAGIGLAEKLDYLAVTYGKSLGSDREALAACQYLDKIGSRLDTWRSRLVRLHGDFKPQNMLCDGTRYVGLDIQWRSVGPAIYDLAPFLNHLWLDGHIFGPLRGHHSYPQCESAFLAGYGCEDDVHAMHWAQLYFALCHLGRYRQKGHLAAAYARWRVGPLVKKLVAQLERSF